MSFNDYTKNKSILHYTPSPDYSIGYNIEYWNNNEYWINSLNINYLIERINKKKSQANLYFKSGFGYLYSDFGKNKEKKEKLAYINVSKDIETRVNFLSYSATYKKSETIKDLFEHVARLGIAPYVANYGEIHTWFFYEMNYMPSSNKNSTSSLILRLFKSTNLFEAGIDEDNNLIFNYIKRF